MRALSRLRARLALLVLLVAVPAALLVHFFAVRAGEALLAQHPRSKPGSGHALLGQEILGLALLGAVTLAAAWIGSRLLDVRRSGALLSAAEQLAAGDPRSRAEMDRDRGGEARLPAGGFDDMTSVVESSQPQLRDALPELWESWREAHRANQLADFHESGVNVPQASAAESPPP